MGGGRRAGQGGGRWNGERDGNRGLQEPRKDLCYSVLLMEAKHSDLQTAQFRHLEACEECVRVVVQPEVVWTGIEDDEGVPLSEVGEADSPMCMDSAWMKWADAWQNTKDHSATSLGISYMLAGDGGASNIDPYAEGPTEDNEWIREGAHLMILAPAELLEAFLTETDNGGPYVMWKGTPYAHLMVPIGSRELKPEAGSAGRF